MKTLVCINYYHYTKTKINSKIKYIYIIMKTLVCINYYHYTKINSKNKKNRFLLKNYKLRLKILEKVISEYEKYENPLDIIIITNSIDGKEFIKKNLDKRIKYIKTPEINLIGDLFLPYASIDIMSKYKNEYDIFIYAEDDMIIPRDTYANWLKYSDLLWRNGYVQYFYRLDINNKLEDSTVPEELNGKILKKYEIEIEGLKFGRLSRPYAGCWILNKDQLDLYLNNPLLLEQNQNNKWPRELIARGLTSDSRLLNKDNEYNKLCSVRVEDALKWPSFKSVGLIILDDKLGISNDSKVIHYNPLVSDL